MADSKVSQIDEIGDLCDDLIEHLEENEATEAIAAAELVLRRVRQFFGQ